MLYTISISSLARLIIALLSFLTMQINCIVKLDIEFGGGFMWDINQDLSEHLFLTKMLG